MAAAVEMRFAQAVVGKVGDNVRLVVAPDVRVTGETVIAKEAIAHATATKAKGEFSRFSRVWAQLRPGRSRNTGTPVQSVSCALSVVLR